MRPLGVTFVADCWGAPRLGAKVEEFCCGGSLLVLLLVLRCNTATANVGEIAIFLGLFILGMERLSGGKGVGGN